MDIRQATIEDLERIVPLFDGYRQFYGQASDPEAAGAFLLERFRQQQSVIFIAEDAQGQGLGFTQLYPSFSSVRLGRSYILNDLFVVPRARRHGVGALLLQAAARFGRSAGAVRLSLSTALDNRAAQALYESQGWQADTVFRHYSLPL
ncbi:GNAT family N-acetyltransferase [Solimonas fluminis]|uniref:GNAT family N-acetyltransferase n=1 Tax=Solimonas fluminis TaxID=2086571 RepID=UPI001A9C784E|nr:GNAT family N-acetyltransferase [Solimonas fluminis]